MVKRLARIAPMQSEDDKAQKKSETSIDEQKPAEESVKTRRKAAGLSDSGFTKAFRSPLSDETDSLARKAEDIQSQYETLRLAKKKNISGVTKTFGELLQGKPSPPEDSLEQRIIDSAASKNDQDSSTSVVDKAKKDTEA